MPAPAPEKHAVARADELSPGHGKLAAVRGEPVIVFRAAGGEYRAYPNLCPHAGAPLCAAGPAGGVALVPDASGRGRPVARCPWHGWEFDLATGEHASNPRCKLDALPVAVEDGTVFVLA